MREQVIKRVEEEKIIAIVRGVDKKDILNFAKAVYEGGIRLLEVTYNAADPSSDEETASKIKLLADEFEGKMLIGAGTVLNEKQVELTKNAGGKFIISPDTNEKVIKKTLELGLVSMPGAFTPTEAQFAHTLGADFVKIFPVKYIVSGKRLIHKNVISTLIIPPIVKKYIGHFVSPIALSMDAQKL